MPVPPPLAAIDLGSNSFHLLIAHMGPGGLQPLQRNKQMVQLARDQRADGQLAPAALARATECLRQFRQLLEQHGVERLQAVGTEALRRCPNPDEIVATWSGILGAPVEIITPEQEARLTFAGLSSDPLVAQHNDRFATIDIGGASTELCCGTAFHIQHWESLPLGCLALGQRFFSPAGPLTPTHFAAAESYCQSLLQERAQRFHTAAATLCLGAAGTMRVIAELIGPGSYDVITLESLRQLQIDCCREGALPASVGEELRWDVLPAGIALLSALLAQLPNNGLRLSGRGIKEGILHKLTGTVIPSSRDIHNTKKQ